MQKVHLISGLPRSGSTLLAALLRQNPRFGAAVTSPVASMMMALLPRMSGTAEFAPFFTDESRYRILRNLFAAYYDTHTPPEVIFDTNRLWTAYLPLADKLFPEARVICCVREVSWVLDSFERLIRKNPAHVPVTFNGRTDRNVYSRVETLMNTESGLVGLAWSSLREAWFGEHAGKLIVIRYESLAREPEQIIRNLYRHLGEAPYTHRFDDIAYDEMDYDRRLGMPGLHRVKQRVEFAERTTVLPPDLFHKYADLNFWLNDKLNLKRVTVL